jgi:TatA/E family protein of Tat protein translocase
VTLAFLDIGFAELLVCAFVALILFGGRLPEVMRSLGAAYRNLRRGFDDVTKQAALPPDTFQVPRPTYTPSAPPAAPSTPATPSAPPATAGAGNPAAPPAPAPASEAASKAAAAEDPPPV